MVWLWRRSSYFAEKLGRLDVGVSALVPSVFYCMIDTLCSEGHGGAELETLILI